VSKKHWLLLAVAALSWYNAGLFWLMQFSCYPLWPYVGRNEFVNYHDVWWQSTWGVVSVPGALVAAGAILMLRFAPPEVPRWAVSTGFGFQLIVEVVTAFWLSTLDRDMVAAAGGLNLPAYDGLLVANWLRIVLVSAYAVLTCWMVTQSFWRHTNITRGRLFLLGTSSLGLYAVGNVWLVQVVCYRLWAHVGRSEAFVYHIAWWHSLWGVLFVPAGLVFLGALALLWIRPVGVSRGLVWLGLALQLVIYVSTAVWWAPLMARLVTPDSGMSLHDCHLLMSTHWIRLALITAYGITSLYMLIKSATASHGSTS
jgi:hypothetical protein